MNRNRISSERVVAVVGLAFVLIAAITSLFFNGDPKSIIEKVADTKIVIPVVHFITLCLTYTHGIKSMLLLMGYSAFCCAFYIWIYTILKAKFSCLFPQNIREINSVIKKPAGSSISLSDYNLNERQISFVLENLYNKMSYKEISEKYFVSISTVKKIFAEVFKIFNVSNIEELRILLLQYQVKE